MRTSPFYKRRIKVGKEGGERRAGWSSAPAQTAGLGSQRELVVDHAGNLHGLAGKFRRREPGLESGLDRRIAQRRWTTRSVGRNHFACFVEHDVNRNDTLLPHPLG